MGREPGYEVSPMRLTQVACAESAVMTVCDLCDVIQIHWFVKAVDKWVPKHPQFLAFLCKVYTAHSTQLLIMCSESCTPKLKKLSTAMFATVENICGRKHSQNKIFAEKTFVDCSLVP